MKGHVPSSYNRRCPATWERIPSSQDGFTLSCDNELPKYIKSYTDAVAKTNVLILRRLTFDFFQCINLDIETAMESIHVAEVNFA